MGLAASQARFLGITARKASCEFKSTELAEEKLELSNQLTDISAEYFNALNATKLVWQSDIADSDEVSGGAVTSVSVSLPENEVLGEVISAGRCSSARRSP